MTKKHKLDILFYNVCYEYESRELMDMYADKTILSGNENEVLNAYEYISKYGAIYGYAQYMLNKKFILSKGIIFKEDVKNWEDLLFDFQIILEGSRIGCVNWQLYHYFRRANSQTTGRNINKFVIIATSPMEDEYLLGNKVCSLYSMREEIPKSIVVLAVMPDKQEEMLGEISKYNPFHVIKMVD